MNREYQKALSEKIWAQYNKFNEWLKDNHLDFDDFVGDSRYGKYKDDAYFLRNLRNMAAHNSLRFVSIMEEAMQHIEDFVSDITAPSLTKIMVPYNKLYTVKMQDKVLPALKNLQENNYSYLPIVNDRKVCEEVFSSYILLSYLCEGKSINDTTTFDDIYSALDNVQLRETCEFLPLESSIVEVINKFKVTDDFHMDVVLVTKDGDDKSPLLGMITVWDLQKK